MASRVRDTLSVVASTARDHAFPPVLVVKMCHLIVCAAQLKAKYGLEIFAFEENIALESVAQVDCVCERGFFYDFVDTGCKNESQVL